MRILLTLLVLTFAAPAGSLDAEVGAVVHGASFGPLRAVQSRLRDAALAAPESFETQLAAAEAYLVGADRLRNERKIVSDMPDAQDAEYREYQALWADEALPLAEHALELASSDAQRAQAERVIGELYAHKITGMISGMMNGPRARRHIGRALELAPDDPECNRAIGLMYLNNPPISGGDVPKAIETFSQCAETLPDDRCLLLLSMAYRKDDQPERARGAAEAALARNPDSQVARLLLAELP